MPGKRCAFLFFILILVFLMVSPGVVLAEDSSAQNTASSTKQDSVSFSVEVSKDGFNNSPEELRLEVVQGQEVKITFVYAEPDGSEDNPHIIYIGGYKVQTDTLNQENSEVTVKFTANKTGEFPITCIFECVGHHRLQNGKLVVLPEAEGSPAESEMTSAVTLTMDAPDQAETGQPLTLVAHVKDEHNENIEGAQVNFFIESDFFVKSLMEIGEMATDRQGLAKIDFTPNQAGILRVVARYEAGKNPGPVEIEREINIVGADKSFYKTLVGIQFPKGFLIWMAAIAVLIIGIWGTFLYVLTQVFYISLGTRSKRIVIILMAVVAAIAIILVWLLVTPEPQYHYGLLP